MSNCRKVRHLPARTKLGRKIGSVDRGGRERLAISLAIGTRLEILGE